MSVLISGAELYRWRQWALEQAQTAAVPPGEVDWLLLGLTDLDGLSLRLGSYQDRSGIGSRYPLSSLTEKWQLRLRQRVPVQYLVGETQWRRFRLAVTPAVLIPRPETELIIDIAQAAVAQSPDRQTLEQGIWVDLGTGSGAIALGLAEILPKATIIAVDFSEAALQLAQQNVDNHGLSHRIQLRQGSWFEPLADLKGQLAGVVSNPPYIPSQTVLTLAAEVSQHEPHTALDGGLEGLDAIRALVAEAPDYLQAGGLWLIEMMAGQAESVNALLQSSATYRDIQTHPDLAEIQRFALAYRM
jgi:release factor glutamine methyltransferase